MTLQTCETVPDYLPWPWELTHPDPVTVYVDEDDAGEDKAVAFRRQQNRSLTKEYQPWWKLYWERGAHREPFYSLWVSDHCRPASEAARERARKPAGPVGIHPTHTYLSGDLRAHLLGDPEAALCTRR